MTDVSVPDTGPGSNMVTRYDEFGRLSYFSYTLDGAFDESEQADEDLSESETDAGYKLMNYEDVRMPSDTGDSTEASDMDRYVSEYPHPVRHAEFSQTSTTTISLTLSKRMLGYGWIILLFWKRIGTESLPTAVR